MKFKEETFTTYKNRYEENLLKKVIPFWENHSIDKEYGGYFTCLTTEGNVYDTDKFSWLQCRQIWTFSKMYSDFGSNPRWLEIAEHGASFLHKFGRGEKNTWYFSLDRGGSPLVQPYNIFSDCFAAMAFGQLSKITGSTEYKELAQETFESILKRQKNPKGKYNKTYPNTRELQNLGLPMILSNLVLELDHVLDDDVVNRHLMEVKEKILYQFYKEKYGLILENVGLNGEVSDTFQGRLINPGHGLETLWFLMDVAEKQGDNELVSKCVDIVISSLEYSWDKNFGGIYYFMDLKGYPPEQLEWNQKLWWPHIEAMIACLKGFYLTGDARCWEWFEKLHDYTWKHFVDQTHGEWFGYLSREGKVLHELKGGKWKGCFHVPRGLMHLTQLMERLEVKHADKVRVDEVK